MHQTVYTRLHFLNCSINLHGRHRGSGCGEREGRSGARETVYNDGAQLARTEPSCVAGKEIIPPCVAGKISVDIQLTHTHTHTPTHSHTQMHKTHTARER